MGTSVLASFSDKRGRRGIYFVSTLAVVVMVSMLVTAAISLVKGSLGASRHLTAGDAAQKAAESGLRYAESKLCANPAWRGDDNGVTVNDPDLVVEERDGNVVGIVRAPGGGYAQFRLRFNWQDGTKNDTDNFDDPPAQARIDHPYVSLNNITGGSPTDVPRADGADFAVSPTSPRPYPIPSGSACIIVEGRVGSGLGDLSPANMNPAVSPGGVISKVVEANFRVSGQAGADAAAMAAGEITAGLFGDDKKAIFQVDSKSGVPLVRSKKKVTIQGGDVDENYVSNKGEVHTSDGQLHAAAGSMAKVTTEVEDADAGFYKLEWEDVKKASGDHKIAAGTYVVWDDGSLHYYDMGFKAYTAFIQENPNNPGSTANLPPGAMTFDFKISGKKMAGTLSINDSVLVNATGKTSEFNLIPRKGAQEEPKDVGGPGAGDYQAAIDSFPSPASSSATSTSWNLTNLDTSSLGTNIILDLGNLSPPNFHFEIRPTGATTAEVIIRDTNGEMRVDLADPASPVDLGRVFDLLENDPRFPAEEPLLATKLQSLLAAFPAGGGVSMQAIDLNSAAEPVSPGPPKMAADDLTVNFQPKKGSSAILSADGNINIAGNVKGTGGSITTAGNLRFVGAGSDLSATIEDGLNLYAKGDIVLSSLRTKDDGSGDYDYKGFKFKGVIYTWGDFQAKLGHNDAVDNWGTFSLQGALVAYGSKNKASLGDPGDGDGGAIRITAKDVKLTFDPAYLAAMQNNVEPGRVEQTLFTVY